MVLLGITLSATGGREDQCSRHTAGEVQATNETTTSALNMLEKALRIVEVGVVFWWLLGICVD